MSRFARKAVGAAVAAVLNMTTLQAAAAEPGDTRWYGWQTLAVDTAATATMIVGVATAPNAADGGTSLLLPTRARDDGAAKSTTTLDVGLALYTFGPAAIHAVHGRTFRSIGSAALRGIAPTAGAAIGLASGIVLASPVALVSAAVLGGVGPMVVDAGVLSTESVETKDAAKTPPPVVTVQPQLSYTKAGPSVGVAGTF